MVGKQAPQIVPSARKQNAELFKSTYDGEKQDSDHDEYHITMAFKHSEDLHQEVLFNTKFEPDEHYEMEDDE